VYVPAQTSAPVDGASGAAPGSPAVPPSSGNGVSPPSPPNDLPLKPAPDAPVSNQPDTSPAAPPAQGPPPVPAGRQRVLAPIDGLDVLVRESFPPQYALQVQAGLPGGCAREAGYEISRSGARIEVSVFNSMPAEPTICTMIYGMYRLSIPLTDLQPGTTYTVVVNDKSTIFTTQ
jgi:hypothetical protein